MTRYDLALKIQMESGDKISLLDAKRYINFAIKEIQQALINGEDLHIRGLGSLKVVQKAERKGRNIKKDEICIIPSHKSLKFVTPKSFKAALNKTK